MRFLTFPNLITFFRLFLVIPFIIFLSNGQTFYAASLFFFIALLDSVDGFVARFTKQQSRFGELFDSTSDVAILVISFFAAGYYGYISNDWHALLAISAAFLVFSKLLHTRLTAQTASTFSGKVTAVIGYAAILASILPLPRSEIVIGAFIACSLYTSVSFLLQSLRKL